MKKVLFKITATLLSLIVVLSSMSFTIDKHYCGETLVDISYFGKADSCCDMKKSSEKPQKKKKKNCCSNETEFITSTTFDKEKVWVLAPKDVQFLVFHLYSYINLYQEVDVEKEFYKDFSPPDLGQDIQILHETFLI
jgi:hypothetical protein